MFCLTFWSGACFEFLILFLLLHIFFGSLFLISFKFQRKKNIIAKRQRNMKDMFSRSVDLIVNDEVPTYIISSTSSCEQQLNRIEMTKLT